MEKNKANMGIGGMGIGVLIIAGIVAWLLLRKKPAEEAPEILAGEEVKVPEVGWEKEEKIIATEGEESQTKTQELIAAQEEELGRPLTVIEVEELKSPSTRIIEKYILPSGLVTAADYEFWAARGNEIEKRARAKEISAQLGIDVSWAEIRDATMQQKIAQDKIEAEARGIKTEERDPGTGEVTGRYPWRSALRHAQAVEDAGTQTLSQYAATHTFPEWYTEADIKRAYESLRQESTTQYYGKAVGVSGSVAEKTQVATVSSIVPASAVYITELTPAQQAAKEIMESAAAKLALARQLKAAKGK